MEKKKRKRQEKRKEKERKEKKGSERKQKKVRKVMLLGTQNLLFFRKKTIDNELTKRLT